MTFLTHGRNARLFAPWIEPWIASGIGTGVVRIQVDKEALNSAIANLEDIAPTTCLPVAPIGDRSRTGPFHYHVISLNDVIEVGVVVANGFQECCCIGEKPFNLCLTIGQSPLRVKNLR